MVRKMTVFPLIRLRQGYGGTGPGPLSPGEGECGGRFCKIQEHLCQFQS